MTAPHMPTDEHDHLMLLACSSPQSRPLHAPDPAAARVCRFLQAADPLVSSKAPAGVEAFRKAAEASITAAGLHLAEGHHLWSHYRHAAEAAAGPHAPACATERDQGPRSTRAAHTDASLTYALPHSCAMGTGRLSRR